MQEMQALLVRKDQLSDAASYTMFQRNLAAAAASRTAAGIARLIRRDLAAAGVQASDEQRFDTAATTQRQPFPGN
jgi:hypothetical protein